MSLPGTKLLLMGGTGTGKTTSIKTWIEAGITPMCIFTEPSFEVIGDVPCPKLHYIYIPPSSSSFADLIDSAKQINLYDMKTLSNLSGINKQKHKEFIALLTALSNYSCQRCGESFGAVDSWDTDKVLVIDSLSGLNIMAMNLVVGSKPVKSQADWGIAMDNLERLIQKISMDLRCHVMLTAHVEPETDFATGAISLMASTLGRKLAPKIPRFFSDVVLARREGSQFYWSTTTAGVDLKPRNLPFSDKIPPTALTIVESWKSRGGVISQPAPVATSKEHQV
jgi:hypothetical protein